MQYIDQLTELEVHELRASRGAASSSRRDQAAAHRKIGPPKPKPAHYTR
jgi:hypothetical protein